MQKEIFSAVAIALTFIAFLPYIRSILRDEIKPHVFSWIIWGSTTFIVFLAQLNDGGGAGAWPIGISGIITIAVAILAYTKKADVTITLADW
jgi:O-antigen/teichoic acid export membrane protein